MKLLNMQTLILQIFIYTFLVVESMILKKVDLIVKTPFVKDKPIFEDAKKTGVLLC